MTVIRNASFVIVLVSLLLTGCHSEKPPSTQTWETRKVDKNSLLESSTRSLSDELIAKIQSDYETRPLDADYSELILSKVFWSENENKYVIFFDVLHIEDIQVVYEVNEDGLLLGKYIFSAWQEN